MARTLYLDCFAGASGDMFIGALLDCGLDFEVLKSELAKLGVEGYELSLERADRSGISAAKFDVHLTHPHGHHHEHSSSHEHSHEHQHHHEHSHEHTHSHSHEHHHWHTHSHEQDSHERAHQDSHEPHQHSGHRGLPEIREMILSSALSAGVKARAVAIFQRIGEAESKIHGIPIETVHFHEVGAIDSIVDIVGGCVGLEILQIEQIISSPLHVGSGTFHCAHGTYPVPGPATTEILKGVPIYSKDIVGELVTPTGAAIIATLAAGYGNLPPMKVERVGYGAGTRIYPKFPNVLRAIIGQTDDATDNTPTTITVIEANIDDLNAQVFGHLMDKALKLGALDIFYTPVQMKKNRPGVLVTLLCRTEDRQRMNDLLFRETTTLGVRYREEQREVLRREHVAVSTAFGEIKMKIARNAEGRVVNVAPEFDDCCAAADQHQAPVREVQAAAMCAYAELPC